jgi:predicted hydrocarbon binding protein
LKHDAARGEWRDGDARYLVIRNDSLMGMFQRLNEPARSEALRALAESLAEHGGRSAAGYRAGDAEGFLSRVTAMAARLGWGRWVLSREEDGLRLVVENSPFAAGYGSAAAPVCAPIAGMLQAVAGLALGAPAVVEETRCAAAGAAECAFRASLRA